MDTVKSEQGEVIDNILKKISDNETVPKSINIKVALSIWW